MAQNTSDFLLQRLRAWGVQRVFGVVLTSFALWFLLRQAGV